jgi:hypothetical protein
MVAVAAVSLSSYWPANISMEFSEGHHFRLFQNRGGYFKELKAVELPSLKPPLPARILYAKF